MMAGGLEETFIVLDDWMEGAGVATFDTATNVLGDGTGPGLELDSGTGGVSKGLGDGGTTMGELVITCEVPGTDAGMLEFVNRNEDEGLKIDGMDVVDWGRVRVLLEETLNETTGWLLLLLVLVVDVEIAGIDVVDVTCVLRLGDVELTASELALVDDESTDIVRLYYENMGVNIPVELEEDLWGEDVDEESVFVDVAVDEIEGVIVEVKEEDEGVDDELSVDEALDEAEVEVIVEELLSLLLPAELVIVDEVLEVKGETVLLVTLLVTVELEELVVLVDVGVDEESVLVVLLLLEEVVRQSMSQRQSSGAGFAAKVGFIFWKPQ
ncbi:hypothetical protein CKAH01_11101 [Colletotrichum kahawae]|uniref:Uncharacterized protein n=1 Tax=Colletotrichum kahawae TaxID=34407 RepID=A0AAD9XUU4_COLKA|nr:hypothetical protein CKAH01_11101 [Colletotrichum kahawae]